MPSGTFWKSLALNTLEGAANCWVRRLKTFVRQEDLNYGQNNVMMSAETDATWQMERLPPLRLSLIRMNNLWERVVHTVPHEPASLPERCFVKVSVGRQ